MIKIKEIEDESDRVFEAMKLARQNNDEEMFNYYLGKLVGIQEVLDYFNSGEFHSPLKKHSKKRVANEK